MEPLSHVALIGLRSGRNDGVFMEHGGKDEANECGSEEPVGANRRPTAVPTLLRLQ